MAKKPSVTVDYIIDQLFDQADVIIHFVDRNYPALPRIEVHRLLNGAAAAIRRARELPQLVEVDVRFIDRTVKFLIAVAKLILRLSKLNE